MNRRKYLVLGLTVALLAILGLGFSGPGRKATLHFSHPVHVIEMEMGCADCHEGIQTLGLTGRSMPDHDVCSSCHDVDDFDTCGTCHVDPDNPAAWQKVTGMYEGFAHDIHTTASVSCEQCHGTIAVGRGPGFPDMQDCQSCHLAAPAALECGICHQGQSPQPWDHKLASWHGDHGLEASFGTSDCAACHTQSSCDECHQGRLLDGRPHPAGWVFNHFVEASFGSDCLACHDTRSYCTDCHRAMAPLPHPLGPGYAGYPNGGLHVEEARAFGETCVSCHDMGGNEPTCARCHE